MNKDELRQKDITKTQRYKEVEIVNIADEARVPIEFEVFGEFRHLVPFQLLEEVGELGFSHQRAGLVPCKSKVQRGHNTV